jgi:oxalate---CoA ligase
MASCYLACTSVLTCAPLNPAYRSAEFEFYLTDLQAKALIVMPGGALDAVEVAQRMNIAIIDLVVDDKARAGQFKLIPRRPASVAACLDRAPSHAQDIAMVLHTSGTTSRPKLVPLTVANVCTSARHIGHTLQLTSQDVGLNIMPLFHIHGLIAGVLAPLAAGSQVFCTPGFDALKFFTWMQMAAPTWYTAVPTMHQAILARAKHQAQVIARYPLRFLRSSSSSMPPQVIKALQEVFGAPLIEAYGMTEAAHQMTSNPLPPQARKPGTVGCSAGPQVAVMDGKGTLLAPGEVGEIVIRGPNVTSGYLANPDANAAAFTRGWFRTGDQGVFDEDGYLSLTGRLKEIINRGGEKISPREVDEVLMDHPAVMQVVCFALPHPKLGEEVAAAVVLKEGFEVSEADIRSFAAHQLASYKVPQKILFLDEIPKGATGKLQRIGLAQKLGL